MVNSFMELSMLINKKKYKKRIDDKIKSWIEIRDFILTKISIISFSWIVKFLMIPSLNQNAISNIIQIAIFMRN